VERLSDEGLNVNPVQFSAKRKRLLIDNLLTRFESGEITLSTDATVLVNELEVFEYDVTEGGQVQYSAPSGFHDDAVDALALACDRLGDVKGYAVRKEQREQREESNSRYESGGVTYL
jgi:hypothetical protein